MAPTVLITGASSGIGKATALLFQQKGWQVAATMRRPEAATDLAALPNVRCVALDVGDRPSIEQAVQATLEAFGDLDVVVNNAGFAVIGPLEAASEEDLQRQFDTNVYGVIRVMQAVLPHFRDRRRGTIINVSSVGGRLAFPVYSLYHGTKWAVEGISESAQFELRPFNIRVRLVEPGAIRTDFYGRSQTPMQKEGLTAYADFTTKVLARIGEVEATAPGPEVVAQTIYQAATDKGDRLRYGVGNGVEPLLLARRLLPSSWFVEMVRRLLT
ncbi:MAG TPA: short-chain dehydrogenase/reductase [Cyanobacteria bacterium UBA8156]|jgi:NAD(P)-dependent dehydrogenase (short-subunit alcohol dehydrogenase family)|nr:short-chain dehydrogenase/reductase [Cyanobacteria bacterium UBA8156]